MIKNPLNPFYTLPLDILLLSRFNDGYKLYTVNIKSIIKKWL